MENRYVQPEFNLDSFNCPNCGAYSHQIWVKMVFSQSIMNGYFICRCYKCQKYSLWIDAKMIHPKSDFQIPPNADLTVDIQRDYLEAAQICKSSPRGAAALLRLCVQKIVVELGENKNDLDKSIGNLVSKGLPNSVQKALDTVRVIGNNAVHPGILDLKDDIETVSQLFWLVNFIAEKMISEPKQISELFDKKVPETQKASIVKRDNKNEK